MAGFDFFGGLGGLGGMGGGASAGAGGGFDVSALLAGLGQSLLTSPRYAPLSGLPAGIQAARQNSQEIQQRAAMAAVAQKLGIDPKIAANPQAMSLLINAQNQEKQLKLGTDAMEGVKSLPMLSGASAVPATPAAGGGARTSFDASSVPSFVTAAGASKGISPDYMARTAFIESKMDPSAVSPTGASGLFQFTKGTARQYGLTDPFDPAASADAAARLAADNKRSLASALGREPSDAELYLAHQQGAGGAAKLLANPKARAGDVVGDQAVRVNGGNPNMTAGEFANLWTSKYNSTAPKGVQVAQNDTGTASDAPAPYKVAAASGAIPVPLQKVPDVAPAHPSTAGDGTTTQRALAQAQAKYGLKQMILGGVLKNDGLTAAGKAAFELAQEYLKPTEIEKTMTAAGIAPSSPQGRAIIMQSLDKRPESVKVAAYAYPDDPQRQQEVLRNGITDARPDVIKLGQHAQDTPGMLKAGIEAEAARKGADTSATKRAEALTEESASATSSGRSARQLITALDDARKYFDQAAAGGGTGPAAASPVGRAVVARAFPAGSQSFKNEVARQNFETAITYVKNMKTLAEQKGTGPLSNMERVLTSADVPDLSVADPEVARIGFNRLRQRLQEAAELDAKLGLHAGEAPTRPSAISTPYGTIRQK